MKGIVYYTDNSVSPKIGDVARKSIANAGLPIVSVSQKPMSFGENICLGDLGRSRLSMYSQILAGIERSESEILFFCEHDVIYHVSHFDFTPDHDDLFYYDQNIWKVRAVDGQAVYYKSHQTSMLVAYRALLLEHYQKRVKLVKGNQFPKWAGHEPGVYLEPRGVGRNRAEIYMAAHPSIDVRHGTNYTKGNKFTKDSFTRKRSTVGWQLSDEIPWWGKTKGRFDEFIREA